MTHPAPMRLYRRLSAMATLPGPGQQKSAAADRRRIRANSDRDDLRSGRRAGKARCPCLEAPLIDLGSIPPLVLVGCFAACVSAGFQGRAPEDRQCTRTWKTICISNRGTCSCRAPRERIRLVGKFDGAQSKLYQTNDEEADRQFAQPDLQPGSLRFPLSIQDTSVTHGETLYGCTD